MLRVVVITLNIIMAILMLVSAEQNVKKLDKNSCVIFFSMALLYVMDSLLIWR